MSATELRSMESLQLDRRQSIPPAFTEYIGSQLIDAVMREEVSR